MYVLICKLVKHPTKFIIFIKTNKASINLVKVLRTKLNGSIHIALLTGAVEARINRSSEKLYRFSLEIFCMH